MLNTIDDAMDLAAALRGISQDTIDTLLLLADNSVGLQEASIEGLKKVWTAIIFVCAFVYFVGQAVGDWWWSQDPIEHTQAPASGFATTSSPIEHPKVKQPL